MMQTRMDAVVLETAPYAFPQLAEAAVDAGRHIFLAKPVAVDVPGCRRIRAAGARAKGKVTFFVDFQIRARDTFQEAVTRLRRGDIGKVALGQVYYHDSSVWPKPAEGLSAAEGRMRNWYFIRALGGDLLPTRDIHALDCANWYMGSPPEKAWGTGGIAVRTHYGDAWDHFILALWYPNGVKVDFSSTEYPSAFRDVCMRFHGSDGTVDSHSRGPIRIVGKNPWTGSEFDNTHALGLVANIKSFGESIRSGRLLHNVDDAVDSTLTCILGRMAAYSGRVVTWQEMLASREVYDPGPLV